MSPSKLARRLLGVTLIALGATMWVWVVPASATTSELSATCAVQGPGTAEAGVTLTLECDGVPAGVTDVWMGGGDAPEWSSDAWFVVGGAGCLDGSDCVTSSSFTNDGSGHVSASSTYTAGQFYGEDARPLSYFLAEGVKYWSSGVWVIPPERVTFTEAGASSSSGSCGAGSDNFSECMSVINGWVADLIVGPVFLLASVVAGISVGLLWLKRSRSSAS